MNRVPVESKILKENDRPPTAEQLRRATALRILKLAAERGKR